MAEIKIILLTILAVHVKDSLLTKSIYYYFDKEHWFQTWSDSQ